ncbi:TPA: hypothetical protein I9Z65_000562 [Clostridium perfringens]|nr:hypothetical protein [Clostridium perfringens]HBC2032375.1 hypothetical protein [Clostridium perfringens]HBC2056110.1 hypothetical protein [Clostridium perfringens]HBC2070230.1 hypothetical protein [Clostridium perfringens]
MLNVTKSYEDAISKTDRTIKGKFVFNDREFNGEQIQEFTLEDDILTNDTFQIGTFIMSVGTAKLIDVDYKFVGKEFELYIGIYTDSTNIEYLKVGIFKVRTVSKKERITSIEFCDRADLFDCEYESIMAYPSTLLGITKEICMNLGVKLATRKFINSSYTVPLKPNFEEGLTYRKVIAQIAELAGGYARINSDGKLEFFNLTKYNNSFYASENTFTLNTDDRILDNRCVIGIGRKTYIDLDTSEALTNTITKLVVKTGDVKAELGEDSGLTYFIENNIFCQNPVDIIEPIFDALYYLNYRKLNVKWIGNPKYQAGDQLVVYDGNILHNTYIMSKKLSFNGALREEYLAEGKTKEETKEATKGNLTLKVEKTIVEVKVAKDEIAQRVKQAEFETYVQQTAKEIKSKVSRGDDLKTEVTQNAESWGVSIDGKLRGRTYIFDGEGFTIGGTEGDVAKHTPNGSEYNFTDGSKAIINKDGFYNIYGNSRNEYHHLNYKLSVQKEVYMPKKNKYEYFYEEYMYFDIPEEFFNKNVSVTANMTYKYFNTGLISCTEATWGEIENNKLKVYVSINSYPIAFGQDPDNTYLFYKETSHTFIYKLEIILTA